jgi:hypothetical protein
LLGGSRDCYSARIRPPGLSDHSRWPLAAVLVCLALAGCGKYYYSHPSRGTPSDFRVDSTACSRDVGFLSGNGQYARVTREPFQRCMLSKGWIREKQVEPGPGWFRGVEGDDVVDLAVGPRQPQPTQPTSATTTEILCRRRHFDGRGDWRTQIPAYEACMGR